MFIGFGLLCGIVMGLLFALAMDPTDTKDFFTAWGFMTLFGLVAGLIANNFYNGL